MNAVRNLFLDESRIEEIFFQCLVIEESNDPYVIVQSIADKTYRFSTKQLEWHRLELLLMLDQLPPRFNKGDSFLNAFFTRSEARWTSSPKAVEQVLVLGIAIGKVKYATPKKEWQNNRACLPHYLIT